MYCMYACMYVCIHIFETLHPQDLGGAPNSSARSLSSGASWSAAPAAAIYPCWFADYIYIYIFIFISISISVFMYIYIYIWWGYLPHNWSAVPVSGNIHNHIIPSYIAGYPQLGEKTTNPKPFVRWGWSLSVRQGMIKKQWFEARNQGFTI